MNLEQIIVIFIIVVLVIATVCILIMLYEIIKERIEKGKEKKKEEFEECEDEDDFFELPDVFDSEEEYSKNLEELIDNKGIIRPITRSQVKFFEKDDGSAPFLDFLNSLEDKKLKEKVTKEIYNLAEQGAFINDTYQSLYIGDDIFGLVVEADEDTEIVVYYYADEEIETVILLNGAIIKSKDDNKKGLKIAKDYKVIYLEKQINELNAEEDKDDESKEDSTDAVEVTKIKK